MAASNRVLALTWVAPYLGFASFETPAHLLSHGVRRGTLGRDVRVNDSSHLEEQVRRLLARFSPSVIAISGAANQKRVQSNAFGRIVRTEAAMRTVEVVLVKDAEIDRAFGQFTEITRYNLATWCAIFFPALIGQYSQLQRKPHYLPLFDAVSVGMGYLSRFGEYGLKFSAVTEATGFQPRKAS